MNIAGIGIVCARGRGMAALEQALEKGWVAPAEAAVPVYAVSPDTLSDKTVLAKARRADRFARMSVLAASDALDDSGLGATVDKSRLAVIVATALGPHVTTFSFLDGILDFGDAAVSPTAFSHSVHNAAASYIAMTLDVRGPTLTLTHFDFAFHQAVVLAQAWLASDRCDAVLVGATDELGTVLQYVCSRMLKPAIDGRIKPFAFSAAPEVAPGEGSVFFVMTRESAGPRYGRVVDVVWNQALPATTDGALHILDACGMAKDETAYRDVVTPGLLTTGYAPLFGSLLTGSAFHAAAAALMLQRQKQYASPVMDNPHDMAICRETKASPLQDVFCTRIGCAGGKAFIHLAR